jgi:hypothetical protein
MSSGPLSTAITNYSQIPNGAMAMASASASRMQLCEYWPDQTSKTSPGGTADLLNLHLYKNIIQ